VAVGRQWSGVLEGKEETLGPELDHCSGGFEVPNWKLASGGDANGRWPFVCRRNTCSVGGVRALSAKSKMIDFRAKLRRNVTVFLTPSARLCVRRLTGSTQSRALKLFAFSRCAFSSCNNNNN